jgi:hypothetical protein
LCPTINVGEIYTPITIEVASHEIDGVHVCALSANFARGTVQFLASARANTQPLNRIEL